jgi:hypothetical protein
MSHGKRILGTSDGMFTKRHGSAGDRWKPPDRGAHWRATGARPPRTSPDARGVVWNLERMSRAEVRGRDARLDGLPREMLAVPGKEETDVRRFDQQRSGDVVQMRVSA